MWIIFTSLNEYLVDRGLEWLGLVAKGRLELNTYLRVARASNLQMMFYMLSFHR